MRNAFITILICCSVAGNAQNFYGVNSYYRETFANVKPISKDELRSVFQDLIGFQIPFKYPQGGCESRAYFMGLLLDSLKVPNSRVWIYAKSQFDPANFSGLHIKDPHFPDKDISWGYHTAPIVLLKNEDGKIDTIVLDPALSYDSPLLLGDWFKKMGGSPEAYYSFVPNKYYNCFLPMQGNFYEYKLDCYDKLLLEKNLAIDKTGNYIYFTYIKDSGKKYNSELVDKFIEIVSNINNFDNYITLNQLPTGLTERKLFTENPDFIIDCKNQYDRQLKYWCERVSSLSKYLNR